MNIAALLSALLAAANVAPDAIRPGAIRAHVCFLADDLLEGRATGSRGHEIAARYVAAQFEALGLDSAGSGGSYLQQVPLRRSEIVEGSSLELVRDGRFQALGTDSYALVPDDLHEQVELAAPVAYAGYGISAPALGYDDYAGLDVRGKVVAVLAGAPARFPNDQRAFYGSRQVKADDAASRGAVALLFVTTPEEDARYSFARMVALLREGTMSWVGAEDGAASLRGRAVLSRAGAEPLFAGAPRSLDQAFGDARAGKPGGFALPVQVQIRARSRHAVVLSPNVLARLPGSDPALAKEHVVLSAHLDHLGIGPAQDGDSIYNGAFDNASGTAVLLEIARVLAETPRRPRRSILFAGLTAEEKGLLGAEYLVHRPPVPIHDVVANLNIDMFLTLFPLRDVIAFGAEHSSLGPVAQEAAQGLGLALSPDPFPEQVIFVRSDHYAFVRQGIPALMLSSGLLSADSKVDGAALFRHWISTVYHSPKDDASQPMDFESAAMVVRLYLRIARTVADMPARPRFNPGDFFGERFGATARRP